MFINVHLKTALATSHRATKLISDTHIQSLINYSVMSQWTKAHSSNSPQLNPSHFSTQKEQTYIKKKNSGGSLKTVLHSLHVNAVGS